jgi:hypothetical protein
MISHGILLISHDSEADAIRERERQMHQELRLRDSDAHRSRQKLQYEQSLMIFNTMLIDHVRKAQVRCFLPQFSVGYLVRGREKFALGWTLA